MIFFEISWFPIICLLKVYTSSSANKLSLYDIKYPYFVNRSVTIKIESKITPVIDSTEGGSLMIKFNTTHFQAPFNAFNDFNSLYSLYRTALFLL
jgi:hypothetical protein